MITFVQSVVVVIVREQFQHHSSCRHKESEGVAQLYKLVLL